MGNIFGGNLLKSSGVDKIIEIWTSMLVYPYYFAFIPAISRNKLLLIRKTICNPDAIVTLYLSRCGAK
jgi:hypothetical protein